MKRTFWHQFLLLFTLIMSAQSVGAIPASRKICTMHQPDGTSLNVRIKGDEYFHFTQSTDGHILLKDQNGYYNYAEMDSSGDLIAGKIKATNADSRSENERAYLKTLSTKMTFSVRQQNEARSKRMQASIRRSVRTRSTQAVKPGLMKNYPTTGQPKSLVILVNFSDLAFDVQNSANAYSNMLNQTDYHEEGHVGSTKDYFYSNSGGLFSPEFVVVGPVTISGKMENYGENDKNGDDIAADSMIYKACIEAAKKVNFADFDFDGDQMVDNVYVFYAGRGEADGGGENTIWPHSSELLANKLELKLHGKTVNTYACSSELNYYRKRSGIGTFTHEYCHILGLPDMYDVDYGAYNGQLFDLGYWSLMAAGSYNKNGAVPPCLSLLERTLLGWATPVELDHADSFTLNDLGSTNTGYIIPTQNRYEYFLLENRQKNKNIWDKYLPHHGLLIYHIDMRPDATTTINYWGTEYTFSYKDMWTYNMVNVLSSHPCADLQEADNERISYATDSAGYVNSLKGDPFPGSKNKRAFSYKTSPIMKTWNGTDIKKPLSLITETDGRIYFDFMEGIYATAPVALPASEPDHFRFKAHWSPLNKAVNYYLDVYTMTINELGDTIKTFASGYENLAITDTFCLVNNLLDQTDYWYVVRATNGYMDTNNSGSIKVSTTKATEVSLFCKDRVINVKGNDHGSPIKLYNAKGIFCLTTRNTKIPVSQVGLYFIEALFDGKVHKLKVLVR